MADWYPVMLSVSGKPCLVVGGGAVAERKIDGLLLAGADVTVVSPDVTPRLRNLADNGSIRWLPREAADTDIAGAMLVFTAAGRPEVNRRVADAARDAGIPVNVADDGEAGDFIVPAVLRRGGFILTAGVSGAGPALASRVVRELSDRYGAEYALYAEALKHIRRTVKEYVQDSGERRRLLRAGAEPEALEEWRHADWLTSEPDRLLDRLRSRAAAAQAEEENR